jgi:hypothetical protein
VLSDAIRDVVPENKSLSSPVSMSGNTVNVVYGARLRLDPKDDASNPITVPCPINMDNNPVNIVVLLK